MIFVGVAHFYVFSLQKGDFSPAKPILLDDESPISRRSKSYHEALVVLSRAKNTPKRGKAYSVSLSFEDIDERIL